MELAALVSFAPARAKAAITSTQNPELALNYTRLASRPSHIKRMSKDEAVNYVSSITDPADINAILAAGEKRVSVLKALSAHKLRPRADALRCRVPDEMRLLDADAASDLALTCTPTMTLQQSAHLYSWVLSLPRHQQGKAVLDIYRALMSYKNEYERPFRDILRLGPIALDVLLGRINGVFWQDLVDLCNETHFGVDALNPGSGLDRLHDLSLEEVQVLLSHGLPVPFATVNKLGDDVVEYLLTKPDELSRLILYGYVTDAERLIVALEGATTAQLKNVLLVSENTELANALIPRVRFSGTRVINSSSLLERYPNLSFEARMAALSNASIQEIRAFLFCKSLNLPRPGEAEALVVAIADEMCFTSLGEITAILHLFDAGAVNVHITEAMQAVLDRGNAGQLLDKASELGRRAVDRIIAQCGDEPAVWSSLTILASEWSGNLDSLINASLKL